MPPQKAWKKKRRENLLGARAKITNSKGTKRSASDSARKSPPKKVHSEQMLAPTPSRTAESSSPSEELFERDESPSKHVRDSRLIPSPSKSMFRVFNSETRCDPIPNIESSISRFPATESPLVASNGLPCFPSALPFHQSREVERTLQEPDDGSVRHRSLNPDAQCILDTATGSFYGADASNSAGSS
ncbi:hypothetical protein BT96DRAFT_1015006 [Gymnopus androsaceus JB14]|uniref:Uncharacterized protein n=1 Tax=Gymnopus androsaceus JB14 TaxID=1447944 RepID=A0A6A4I333_9AGAR|nr:hypothetical protein BT96DRAFT_1015006 [Gymnopus androsaceus JB14]